MALPPVALAPAPPARAVAPPAPRVPFGEVLRATRAPPSPAVPPAPGAGQRLLEAVERARARLDAALVEARRGRTFTAGELLALQGDAYRSAQTLELASRIVEHGAQAVRQAVNTQV